MQSAVCGKICHKQLLQLFVVACTEHYCISLSVSESSRQCETQVY